MAQLNFAWIPAEGIATGQRILRIAKVNGTTPNLVVTFTPANDLSASQAVATAEDLNTNTIYRFKVQTLCPEGDPIDNSNGVIEDLVFECIDEGNIDVLGSVNGLLIDVSVKIEFDDTAPVDGGAAIEDYTDIQKVEVSIYDAANAVEIKPPVEGTIVDGGGAAAVSIPFTGLSPDTDYTLRYTLITTINGGEVRSDNVAYLGTPCTHEFTTDPLP